MVLDISSFYKYFLTILVSVVVFYGWLKYKINYWKRLGVPMLPTHWLFGNFKDVIFMKDSAGVILGKLYEQGNDHDVVGIYAFWKPMLLIRNTELIKQILVKDFNIFPNRYFSSKDKHDVISYKNLFSLDNPEWKYLRQKMTAVFSSGKIKKFFNLIVEVGNDLKDHLNTKVTDVSKPTVILVHEICRKYSTDVISSLAFGVRSNSFVHNSEFFKRIFKGGISDFINKIQLFVVFFFPWLANFTGGSILGDATGYFRKIFWDSMNEREASGSKRGDLIDSLLELKNDVQEKDFKFEGDTLLAQSAVFFVAGLETSATTMSFALCELAKRPDIQDRVRQEILETLRTEGLTYDSIQQMKYLHQVISETLRMYPPAPIIDRLPVADYQIPGTKIVIEKDTPVYVPLFGLHFDRKYFKNPWTFDPDRFNEENKQDIVSYTYMPFGDGPRICIGMRVGMLQVAVGLVSILSNYEISLNSSTKVEIDRHSVFLRPPQDLVLSFQKLSKVN